jgi:hypothetical protein
MLKQIWKRVKEPSSWAGAAALAVLVGVDPSKINEAVHVLGAVAGAVAILLPEKARAE